jgi:hypothetical protein
MQIPKRNVALADNAFRNATKKFASSVRLSRSVFGIVDAWKTENYQPQER